MQIPVVIVDDEETDRYIAKRRLSSAGGFGEIHEAAAGDDFLEMFFNGRPANDVSGNPLLVLMDINMPRMSGFETVGEVQRRMENGKGPDSIVVMMFTSSDSPEDKARAEELGAVKGYLVKPLDEATVSKIRDIYQTAQADEA